MKGTLLASVLAICLSPPAAMASCVGTGAYQTCTDDSGNSYNIQRYGNTTNVQGFNPNTGSSWSQNSNTVGSSTYHNGYSADGNSWNGTSTTIGGTTYNSGTDSDGNYYQSTCNEYGCY